MSAARPLLEDATVRYKIDANASQFVVQAFSTGLFSAFAHNPRIAIHNFEGDLSFTQSGATLQDARVRITVQADSLEVIDDISERDRGEIQARMREEVLLTGSFPEIVYECSRVTASGSGNTYWAALSGTLTLRGVTQSLPISAKVTLNGNSLKASGEFMLRQSLFGIATVTAVGGTIRLKDDLKCNFEIAAARQE
ncbi:MAG: YceI family protein [Candidatus Sulfotelmatobacter sp.]